MARYLSLSLLAFSAIASAEDLVTPPKSNDFMAIGVEAYLIPTSYDYTSTIKAKGSDDINDSGSEKYDNAYRIGICGGLTKLTSQNIDIIMMGHIGYEQMNDKYSDSSSSFDEKTEGVYVSGSLGPRLSIAQSFDVLLMFGLGMQLGWTETKGEYSGSLLQRIDATGDYVGFEGSVKIAGMLRMDKVFIMPFIGYMYRKSNEDGTGTATTAPGFTWIATGTRTNTLEYENDTTQKGAFGGVTVGVTF